MTRSTLTILLLCMLGWLSGAEGGDSPFRPAPGGSLPTVLPEDWRSEADWDHLPPGRDLLMPDDLEGRPALPSVEDVEIPEPGSDTGTGPQPTAKAIPRTAAGVDRNREKDPGLGEEKEEPADEATWYLRDTRLPRLGATLTTGRLAPRPLGPDYRLRPGDRVRVVTWGGVSMNEVLPVDAGGSLALPGFGAVPVAGRPVVDVQAALTELARGQFKNAGVLLGLERPGALAVTVVGEVEDPGYHTVPSGSTLIDALSAAGGVLPRGSLRTVRIQEPGAAESATVDLYPLATDGGEGPLVPLVPGSLVVVPLRGVEVLIFGAVHRPSAVEMRPGDHLDAALRLAGGLTAEGDPEVVRLVREGASGQTMTLTTREGLAGIEAADGDRLMVGTRSTLDQARRTVRVAGRVRSPGTYPWTENLSVDAIIALAGGLLPDANRAGSLILRQRGEPIQVDQGSGILRPLLFDLVGPLTGEAIVQPLDELTIPAFPPRQQGSLSVKIGGAVFQPGTYPFVPGMTAGQLLFLAGGITSAAQAEEADLVRVQLEADGTRSVSRSSIDPRSLLAGDPGPELRPRDEIVVRTRNDRRLTVAIDGAVRNSGSFAVPQGTTVGELLAQAGGLTDEAFPEGIRLFRVGEVDAAAEYLDRLRAQIETAVAVNKRTLLGGEGGAVEDLNALRVTIAQQESEIARMQQARATGRLLGVDFRGIVDGRADADVTLQNGDRIIIPIRPDTLRIFGEVMNPGSFRYEAGMRVETAVARSGGYTQQADTKRVFVVRADGAVVASASGRGLAWDQGKRSWISTSLKSISLVEGDTVIVPPDLDFKASKMVVAKDLSQILFQIAVAAATVIAIAP